MDQAVCQELVYSEEPNTHRLALFLSDSRIGRETVWEFPGVPGLSLPWPGFNPWLGN